MDGDNPESEPRELLAPEVIEAGADEAGDEINETIDHPAKVMRIGTMLKQLLAEVRSTDLDEASRQRLREIYETSVGEVGSALSPDLREELTRLASPFDEAETPSAMELQVAKAQLVGWLEGLIQGMKAMLLAQQMSAHQQLQSMRGELPPGADPYQRIHPESDPGSRPGTYL
ncbi:MAG: DUF2587 domain-containing protein [Acidimicrobiaceae bacterium]|nr:DUF2587 domain-containing protein [Acidimicrobiaceae bacterium]MDE0516065.1 DUF2587 domain-containing protein [Acidimicrobiaceae bacterium]MXZ95471.1 DUF2587 domain-containing protein [Acidimicrobiaceae bacterium]MYF42864.1 DUF2587 domain-containing protein [Acidimicrobiaceae bacterium]